MKIGRISDMFSITDGCLRNDGGESVGEKIIMPARHMEFE